MKLIKIMQYGRDDWYRCLATAVLVLLPLSSYAEAELMQPVEEVHFIEIAPPWLSTPISKAPARPPSNKPATVIVKEAAPQKKRNLPVKAQLANNYHPQNFSIDSLIATAKQGNVASQYQLGMRYQYGDGIKKNRDESHRWLEKSAKAGHAKAQHALSLFYQQYVKNMAGTKKALLWEKKAADQGLADAQYSLGMMFQNGSLVNRNAAEARRWLQKAARQGHMPAKLALR